MSRFSLGFCAGLLLGLLIAASACAPRQWTPTPDACWPGRHTLTTSQDEACERAADLDYDRGAE